METTDGDDAEAAALKIQSIARGKRDRDRVTKIKETSGVADGSASAEEDVSKHVDDL